MCVRACIRNFPVLSRIYRYERERKREEVVCWVLGVMRAVRCLWGLIGDKRRGFEVVGKYINTYIVVEWIKET